MGESPQGAVAEDRRDMSSVSDHGLVSAIAGGDHDSFAEVYRRYGSRIHGIAQRMCSASCADDVMQEVFVRLWNEPERYDPSRGSLPSFLIMQAHGRAVDWLRSDGSRRARESTEFLRRTPSGVEVEDAAVARLVGDSVALVLSTLPDRQRDSIVLAYFGGHTYREVAVMLDRPEATVKSQIRSGLARLRSQLTDLHPTGGMGRTSFST